MLINTPNLFFNTHKCSAKQSISAALGEEVAENKIRQNTAKYGKIREVLIGQYAY